MRRVLASSPSLTGDKGKNRKARIWPSVDARQIRALVSPAQEAWQSGLMQRSLKPKGYGPEKLPRGFVSRAFRQAYTGVRGRASAGRELQISN
jgi:hypothetical protein